MKYTTSKISQSNIFVIILGDKVTDLFCFYHLNGSLQVLEAGNNGQYDQMSRVLLTDFCKV